MSTAPKPILPLATPVADIPVPANDPLPIATIRMANIRQRLPRGCSRVVAVEVKKSKVMGVRECVERALFPRIFWAVCGASFDQEDAETEALMARMLRDIEVWADLMLPSQRMDFERELNHSARSALQPLLDLQIGNDGGWSTIKLVMVFMLLVQWVEQHAEQAMFTSQFAAIAQDILTHIDLMFGDECDAVEASAHKQLPKVIKKLKACGLFAWLPDYRGAEE